MPSTSTDCDVCALEAPASFGKENAVDLGASKVTRVRYPEPSRLSLQTSPQGGMLACQTSHWEMNRNRTHQLTPIAVLRRPLRSPCKR